MRGDIIDLDALAEAVEARLARRMVSQHGSPLGSRAHRAAVLRRVERQEGGAAIAKRKFLLSRDALKEELDRSTAEYVEQRKTRGPRKARSDQSPDLDALQRELTGGLRNIREVR